MAKSKTSGRRSTSSRGGSKGKSAGRRSSKTSKRGASRASTTRTTSAKTLARQIQKEEEKLGASQAAIERKKAQLERLRRTCTHTKLQRRKDGVVVCVHCLQEVAFPPEYWEEGDESPDQDYES